MRKHTEADVAATLIAKSIDAEGGCRVWAGGAAAKGYGGIRFKGRMDKAHRVSYMIFVGPIPSEMHVLHSCDNRKCIEPAHLFLGTNADNIKDKCKKDRSGKKLTIDLVKEIRRAYAGRKVSQTALGRAFGVNPSNISRAVNGKRWAHA